MHYLFVLPVNNASNLLVNQPIEKPSQTVFIIEIILVYDINLYPSFFKIIHLRV